MAPIAKNLERQPQFFAATCSYNNTIDLIFGV
jgi:hypothetical protein